MKYMSGNIKKIFKRGRRFPVDITWFKNARESLRIFARAHPADPVHSRFGFASGLIVIKRVTAPIFVIALIVATTGAVAASQSSVPGDVLYPLKLTAEQAQIAFTSAPRERARLHMRSANRRMEEMTSIAARTEAPEVRRAHVEQALAHYRGAIASARIEVSHVKDTDAGATTSAAMEFDEDVSRHQETLANIGESINHGFQNVISHAIQTTLEADEDTIAAVAASARLGGTEIRRVLPRASVLKKIQAAGKRVQAIEERRAQKIGSMKTDDATSQKIDEARTALQAAKQALDHDDTMGAWANAHDAMKRAAESNETIVPMTVSSTSWGNASDGGEKEERKNNFERNRRDQNHGEQRRRDRGR